MPCISVQFLLNPSSSSKTLELSSALLSQLTRIGLLHMNLPSPAFSAACNIIPWNALISSLSRRRVPLLALQAFSLMHRISLPLDSYSLCTAISAASKTANFGRQIHAYASKSGELSSVFVGGGLIDFYARTDGVEDAHQVFDEIPLRNTVCLNALLSGYVERMLWMDCLSLFRSVCSLRIEPDGVTVSVVLRVCGEMCFVRLGMQCHAYLVRRVSGMEKDVFLLSSLVEMYGKCGLVGKAHFVFRMSENGVGRGGRDVVLWTSALNAEGRNGMFGDVISTFERMLVEGVEPDEIVMLVVLSACARCGDVMKGLMYFESMIKKYKLVPRREHYSCVVDLLCRAGELEKAWNFVDEIASKDNGDGGEMFAVSAWGAILSACSDSGNARIGKLAFQRAIQLDQDNVGVYVELSNLYARVGLWDELAELRKLMLDKGIKKDIGCSRLEIRN